MGRGREPVPAPGRPRPEPRRDGAGRRQLREGDADRGDRGARLRRPRDRHAGQGADGPRASSRSTRPRRTSSAPRSSGCSSSPSAIRSCKANPNFRDLQAQLEGTENRIAVARGRFNESAQAYNTALKKFPTNMLAGFFGFKEKPYFKATTAGAEQAPQASSSTSAARRRPQRRRADAASVRSQARTAAEAARRVGTMDGRGARRAVSGRFAASRPVACVASCRRAALRADRYDDHIPPKPQRYVTDRAGVLGPGEPEALNAKLEQFERDTSNQILVWIDSKVPEGFTLEDFTVRAAQKWGAGQKKEDNGAVLFVFPDDRKVRIEVGYGLEGALPDVTAKRIIDDEIVPHFRQGDYAGRRRRAGVDALMAAVKGEYKGTGPDDRRGRSGARPGDDRRACSPLLIFFGDLLRAAAALRRRRRRWRTSEAEAGGRAAAGSAASGRRVEAEEAGSAGEEAASRAAAALRRRRRLGELVDGRRDWFFAAFDSDRIVDGDRGGRAPAPPARSASTSRGASPKDLEARAERALRAARDDARPPSATASSSTSRRKARQLPGPRRRGHPREVRRRVLDRRRRGDGGALPPGRVHRRASSRGSRGWARSSRRTSRGGRRPQRAAGRGHGGLGKGSLNIRFAWT